MTYGARWTGRGWARTIGLAAMLALVTAAPASALLLNFETTGERAERIDALGYLPSQGFGPVGGPAANGSLGYAMQFQIAQQTRLNRVHADILVQDYHLGEDYVAFDFKIYSGTAVNSRFSTGYIPDIATLIGEQPVYVTNHAFTDVTHHYETGNYDLDLEAGTYWLAYERAAGESTSPGWIGNLQYSVPGSDVRGVIVNPEPASLGLFALGLLGVGGLMRKKR